MGAGRIVGGILALIGSALMLIPMLLDIVVVFSWTSFEITIYFIVFIVVILALVGAILALANKRGVLALIMGIVLLVFCILPYLVSSTFTSGLALFTFAYSGWEVWIAPQIGVSLFLILSVTFETILILVGGIVATAAGE
jgi:hypothetical protein